MHPTFKPLAIAPLFLSIFGLTVAASEPASPAALSVDPNPPAFGKGLPSDLAGVFADKYAYQYFISSTDAQTSELKSTTSSSALTTFLTNKGIDQKSPKFAEIITDVKAMDQVLVDVGTPTTVTVAFWDEYRTIRESTKQPVASNSGTSAAGQQNTGGVNPQTQASAQGTTASHEFFISGLRLLSPFTINSNPTSHTATLSATSKSTGFIDFALDRDWAWDLQGNDDPANNETHQNDKWGDYTDQKNWDFMARVGYDFGSTGTTSAATIVGSGLSASVNADYRFYQNVDQYSRTRSSIGPTFSWSGVTDSNAFDIHNEFMVGLAASSGFAVNGTTSTPGHFRLEGGIARLATPELTPQSSRIGGAHSRINSKIGLI